MSATPDALPQPPVTISVVSSAGLSAEAPYRTVRIGEGESAEVYVVVGVPSRESVSIAPVR